jgi:hypothetical protein
MALPITTYARVKNPLSRTIIVAVFMLTGASVGAAIAPAGMIRFTVSFGSPAKKPARHTTVMTKLIKRIANADAIAANAARAYLGGEG